MKLYTRSALFVDTWVLSGDNRVYDYLGVVYLLRCFPDKRDLSIVTHDVITSRLNYCNIIYVPVKVSHELQLTQNAVAVAYINH